MQLPGHSEWFLACSYAVARAIFGCCCGGGGQWSVAMQLLRCSKC